MAWEIMLLVLDDGIRRRLLVLNDVIGVWKIYQHRESSLLEKRARMSRAKTDNFERFFRQISSYLICTHTVPLTMENGYSRPCGRDHLAAQKNGILTRAVARPHEGPPKKHIAPASRVSTGQRRNDLLYTVFRGNVHVGSTLAR
jgi:hypothetical protein